MESIIQVKTENRTLHSQLSLVDTKLRETSRQESRLSLSGKVIILITSGMAISIIIGKVINIIISNKVFNRYCFRLQFKYYHFRDKVIIIISDTNIYIIIAACRSNTLAASAERRLYSWNS